MKKDCRRRYETCCVLCDCVDITLHAEMEPKTVNGHTGPVALKYWKCNGCGSEYASPQEISENANAMRRFKQRHGKQV